MQLNSACWTSLNFPQNNGPFFRNGVFSPVTAQVYTRLRMQKGNNFLPFAHAKNFSLQCSQEGADFSFRCFDSFWVRGIKFEAWRSGNVLAESGELHGIKFHSSIRIIALAKMQRMAKPQDKHRRKGKQQRQKKTSKLLYFEWSPPWHFKTGTCVRWG